MIKACQEFTTLKIIWYMFTSVNLEKEIWRKKTSRLTSYRSKTAKGRHNH